MSNDSNDPGLDPRTELVLAMTDDQKAYVLAYLAATKSAAFDDAVIQLFNHERQMARAIADMFPLNAVAPF